MGLKQFVHSAYPFYYKKATLHFVTLLIVAAAFLFLFFFEPFLVYPPEHKMPYWLIALIQSIVPGILFYMWFLFLPLFSITRPEDKWTVGREVLHLSVLLLLMGSANFLLRDVFYDNPENWSMRYYLEEVAHTYMIGILLVVIFVPLNYLRVLRRNQKISVEINEQVQMEPGRPAEDKWLIKTKVKADDFLLTSGKFIFARADGNYAELFLEGREQPLLKRISLTELKEQMAKEPQIMRTHRAFLVNLKKIKQVKGNAGGLQLTMEKSPHKVPVSRSNIKLFRQLADRLN